MPDFEDSYAFARAQLANLLHELGDNIAAKPIAEEATEAAMNLNVEFPTNARYADGYAQALAINARIEFELRSPSRTLECIETATILIKQRAIPGDRSPALREQLAILLIDQARAMNAQAESKSPSLKRPLPGDEAFREARQMLEELQSEHPDVPSYQQAALWCRFHQGMANEFVESDSGHADLKFVADRWRALPIETTSAQWLADAALFWLIAKQWG